MSPGWKDAYAAMHRAGEASFPPAGLHYVLELVRHATRARGAALSPADTIASFRRAARADFGPLRAGVLAEWGLETPAALGSAIHLLARHDCLTLEESESPEDFTIDPVPLTDELS
jgi:uncharacterized repeat protein (TIGR04138 family)